MLTSERRTDIERAAAPARIAAQPAEDAAALAARVVVAAGLGTSAPFGVADRPTFDVLRIGAGTSPHRKAGPAAAGGAPIEAETGR